MVQRINRTAGQDHRLRQVRLVVQQGRAPSDRQGQPRGRFVLALDGREDPLGTGLVGRQGHIAGGDAHVALGQGQLHVGQEGREEIEVSGEIAELLDRQAGPLDARGEAVPARQHEAGLRPAEHPRNGPQVLDLAAGGPAGWTAADVEADDLADRGDRPEEVLEGRIVIHQGAEAVERGLGQGGHRRLDLGVGLVQRPIAGDQHGGG